jgi:hypothetical protein
MGEGWGMLGVCSKRDRGLEKEIGQSGELLEEGPPGTNECRDFPCVAAPIVGAGAG